MDPNASPVRSWMKAEALRHTLVDAAKTLEPGGIELLAIKGIYFVHALGVEPAAREMLDADAVVVHGSFQRAVRLLTASGNWTATAGWSARALTRVAPPGGSLDLHRMPLPPFFGRMRAASLRRRAIRHSAFDGHVLTPDPADAACMAIAHFVKDCLGQVDVGLAPRALWKGAGGGLARDLGWLEERAALRPAALAERLTEHRLRRAGIVAFIALTDADVRWRSWLTALAPSRAEQLAGAAMVRALRQYALRHPELAFLVVRAVGDSAVRSACGLAATGARLIRDRAVRAVTSNAAREPGSPCS